MPTSIIAPKVLGPVIKHEGECYDFTPAFFGTHTAAGITYTWAKGNDWP